MSARLAPAQARRRVPLLVISPHCDDAVLACGDLILRHPGAVVLTVFAAGPERYAEPSDWDRRAGFAPGEDVMAARRAEDRAALTVLGAEPRWLAHRDRQYGAPPALDDLTRDVAVAVDEADPFTVALPLGLFHSDHQLVHEAALRVRGGQPWRGWLAYADALYRRLPGLVEERLGALARAGIRAVRSTDDSRRASPVKRSAVACYASQLRALATPGRPGVDDAYAPEVYWRLERQEDAIHG